MTVARPAGTSRLMRVHRHWRAASYLAAAQLCLRDNVLLEQPLRPEHVKTWLLGRWRPQPALNLVYAHLNRLIVDTAAKFALVVGVGGGGPALLANLFLEGTLGESDPSLQRDSAGMRALVRRYGWPGWTPLRIGPSIPGAIGEGCDMGSSLSHAFGAALDSPETIVACVIGGSETETGLLASLHSNRFLDPTADGAVLPILHLDDQQLSAPSLFACMSKLELHQYFYGSGYEAREVIVHGLVGDHAKLLAALDWAYDGICDIRETTRKHQAAARAWPIIVLRTPNGWADPNTDALPAKHGFSADGPPIVDLAADPAHLAALETWLRGYEPRELFDGDGRPATDILESIPPGKLRMGKNPQANAGAMPLDLPQAASFGVESPIGGTQHVAATLELGLFLRDVAAVNAQARAFRVFLSDGAAATHLGITGAACAVEVSSAQASEGLLEGYTLTGRHGLHVTDEARSASIELMVERHERWLSEARERTWREPVPSLNLALTSRGWQQDDIGSCGAGHGIIESLVSNHGSGVHAYFPPDANCLIWVMRHCLETRDRVNLIAVSLGAAMQWLNRDQAAAHCLSGASEWAWASDDDPDVVIAAAGDIVTKEALAAIWLLRFHAPRLRLRFVNVVDLLALDSPSENPHGLDELVFDRLFTRAKPVVFAFQGYPRLIHALIHRRSLPQRFHVRGYTGDTAATTPFDAVARNGVSRYHLALEALRRADARNIDGSRATEHCKILLDAHQTFVLTNNRDMPQVAQWRWTSDSRAEHARSAEP